MELSTSVHTWFRTVLRYSTSCLIGKSLHYAYQVFGPREEWKSTLQAEVKARVFDLMVPVSTSRTINELYMACNNDGLHGNASMGLFRYLAKSLHLLPYLDVRHWKGDGSVIDPKKVQTTHCKVLNSILQTNGTDHPIAKGHVEIARSVTTSRMSP